LHLALQEIVNEAEALQLMESAGIVHTGYLPTKGIRQRVAEEK
jgi:pyridoxal/pyridoxine/pyridoxamine kinase